jgi:hypothetical protein
MAFGNSDGDLQMLQYTTAGDGARCWLRCITPMQREYAYDRDSEVGRLTKVCPKAKPRLDGGGHEKDWKKVFLALKS